MGLCAGMLPWVSRSQPGEGEGFVGTSCGWSRALPWVGAKAEPGCPPLPLLVVLGNKSLVTFRVRRFLAYHLPCCMQLYSHEEIQ